MRTKLQKEVRTTCANDFKSLHCAQMTAHNKKGTFEKM